MVAGSEISVLNGKSGWLFLQAFGSNAYLKHAHDLSNWRRHNLPKHIANYVARHRRVVDRDIPFVVVFAPEASGIYGENLPDGWSVEQPTACEVLAEQLAARGVNVVCPSVELRRAKGAVDLCQRLDSHWSYWGAYICYRRIVDALGEKFRSSAIPWQDVWYGSQEGYGDLGVHAVPERKGDIQTIEIPSFDVVADRNVYDVRDKNVRRFTCSRGKGKALVFRDSFANFLSPFLERTFAETILVAPAPTMPDSAVDWFKPDLVILEVAERGLFGDEDPLSDWSVRTFAQEYLELAQNKVGGRLQVDATNLIASGKAQEAIATAAAAIAIEGDGSRPYNLAWALHNSGQYDLCYKLTSQISASRNDRFLYYLQANSAYFRKQFQEAVTAIDAAIQIQPHNATYLFLKGAYLMELESYAEAAKTFTASIRYAPTHGRSWSGLLAAYGALKQFDDAAKAKQEAAVIFGHDIQAGL
jgi:Flp pilus assembly protein TadD